MLIPAIMGIDARPQPPCVALMARAFPCGILLSQWIQIRTTIV